MRDPNLRSGSSDDLGGRDVIRSTPSPLRRMLGGIDFFCLAFGTVVGAGWVVLMHDWLRRGGPIGAISAFLLGGLLLTPVGVIYGRLTALIPKADSELAFNAIVFPPSICFVAGWMMVLSYLIICPYEAIAIGEFAAYLMPSLERFPLYSVAGSTVYLPKLLLGCSLIVVLALAGMRGMKSSATIQNSLSFATIGIFLFFIILGSSRASIHGFHPLFADGDTVLGGLSSTLRVLQIVPYFLAGFEAVSRFSEERSPGFRERHFTGVILTALWAGVVFYAATIAVVALLVPWQDLTTSSLVTLVAFHRAFESRPLVNLILVAAIVSLIKVYNSCMLSASRLIFSMGRIGLIHESMADVDRSSSVPVKAIVLVSILAALGCCLGKVILVPISEVGSFCFTVGWFLTSASYLLKAGGPACSRLALGTLGVAVTGTLILLKLLPVMPDSFRFWEYCSLAIWTLLGVVLWLTRDRLAAGRLSEDP